MAEETLAERRVVPLRFEEAGEAVDMEVMVEVTVDDRLYGLVTPTSPQVSLFAIEDVKDGGEGELQVDEVDDEKMKSLKKDVNDALKDLGLSVTLKAGEYWLDGELTEEQLGELELVDFDGEDEEEGESYFILADLDTGKERYWVAMPADPPIYPVEFQGDTPRLLEDEELEQLDDVFRAAMEGSEEEETN